MFEKILIATDFSRYAVKTLEGIVALPGLREVVLLHVVDAARLSVLGDLSFVEEVEEARAQLDLWARYLQEKGIEAKPVVVASVSSQTAPDGADVPQRAEIPADRVLVGTVSRAIKEVAEEEKVSLTVVGSRGRGRVKGVLLGSVSRDVLRYGTTDLLVVRHETLEGLEIPEELFSKLFSMVMVPTDFSSAAGASLTLVKELEGVGEAALAHVVTRGEKDEEVDAAITEAARRLKVHQKELEDIGIKATVHVDAGDPGTRIAALAAKEKVSLIVMSSLGKGWLEQLRVGSVTLDVARMAAAPVLVVRVKDTGEV